MKMNNCVQSSLLDGYLAKLTMGKGHVAKNVRYHN